MTVLDRLNAFLNVAEPKLVRLLVGSHLEDAATISYQSIVDALLAGNTSLLDLSGWQQRYSKFVTTSLVSAYESALSEAAHSMFQETGKPLVWNPVKVGAHNWVRNAAASLVSSITDEQRRALGVIIPRITDPNMGLTMQQAAQSVRPLVGLTAPEGGAVVNFMQMQVASGVKVKMAQVSAANYAAKLHRSRALRIARTEMVMAWNAGQRFAADQVVGDGLASGYNKMWSTSADERTCGICGGLDGVTVEEHAAFPGGFQTSPAHPNCRCAVEYQFDD